MNEIRVPAKSEDEVTIASVVNSKAAILAALLSAVWTTFVGSMTPIFTRSPYSSAAAL
jgi:hypothetical protein